jgi:dinuclear metal center YbgI/SA1388 family protein
MAELGALVQYLDSELRIGEVPDYDAALNGLQLANSGQVSRIAAAVDFSGAAVSAAVREKAQLLLVHHGMFWHTERLVGSAYTRLRDALRGDLAVYSAHLPLDVHASLGNNALLARELGLQVTGGFGKFKTIEVGVRGQADISTKALADRLSAFVRPYATTVVSTPFDPSRKTRFWAIVTGAGASTDTLEEARALGIDTMIVGEGPHHTAVRAMDDGMVVIYAGHYATETLGVRALAERTATHFGMSWTFLSLPTGL